MQTVSALTITFMAASFCLAVILPIVLLILLLRKRARFLSFFTGAAVFLVFVLVLEVQFANLITSNKTFLQIISSNAWLYALYGGLQAGLFEETGRLLAFRYILRRRHNSVQNALCYGMGHGGIEAIVLVGIPMLINMIVSIMVNVSGADIVLDLVPAYETALNEISRLAPVTYLAAGVERVIALSFHLAASVLVWMAAVERGPWGLYFLAILFHTLLNIPAGLYQFGLIQSIWLVELICGVLSVAICLVTAMIYNRCSQTYTPLLPYDPSPFDR